MKLFCQPVKADGGNGVAWAAEVGGDGEKELASDGAAALAFAHFHR